LTVNGEYDTPTFEAVKDFQNEYAEDVLEPWGIDEPTGYTYITTLAKINALLCVRLADDPLPELIPGIRGIISPGK